LACQEEFFVNIPLDIKENDEHALNFAPYFPLEELFPCLKVMTIIPALVTSDNPGQEGCIVRRDLMKLLADVDTLLLLISCQKSHQVRYRTPNKST
jgi:hypothetical protein